MTRLRDLVQSRALSTELAALIWILAEHGVPLVVAGQHAERASAVRQAFTSQVLADQPTRDAVAGGVVLGQSLEDVLRVLGASPAIAVTDDHGHPGAGVADEARDLGVVVVVDEERMTVAHYVRPVERDAAGHLQRRPPAVLGAWNDEAAEFDDFWWALTDELATRAGMTRHELEDEVEARLRHLAGDESVPGPKDARH